MKKDCTLAAAPVAGAVDEALTEVQQSFERLCLAAGIEALGAMMEADVEAACGPRHERVEKRTANRWGSTRGAIGFHGGKVGVERPRVRGVRGLRQIQHFSALSRHSSPDCPGPDHQCH